MFKKLSILFLVTVLLLGAAMSAQAALVAHYKFDEGTGTTAVDSSATGNNATLENGVTWDTTTYGTPYAVNYDFGDSAVSFVDRTDTTQERNRVIAPDNNALDIGTGSVTISFMVKKPLMVGTVANNPPDQTTFICKGSRRPLGASAVGTFDGKRYEINHKGGNIAFVVDDNAEKLQLNGANGDTIRTGEWVHVVGVYDITGGQMRLYFNGALATVPAPTTNPMGIAPIGDLSTDLPLLIGNFWVVEDNEDVGAGGGSLTPDANWYTESLTGSMDDVRIYNTALSDAEVATIYPPFPTATPTPFVAGAEHWEIFD